MKSSPKDQKAIGASFPQELAAAGLLGEHFSWRPTGEIEFFEDTPDQVKGSVLEVYAAHDPSTG